MTRTYGTNASIVGALIGKTAGLACFGLAIQFFRSGQGVPVVFMAILGLAMWVSDEAIGGR